MNKEEILSFIDDFISRELTFMENIKNNKDLTEEERLRLMYVQKLEISGVYQLRLKFEKRFKENEALQSH